MIKNESIVFLFHVLGTSKEHWPTDLGRCDAICSSSTQLILVKIRCQLIKA